MLYFSDPDKRNDFVSGAYTPNDVRTAYPLGPNVPVPVGPTHYEKVTVDANGCITNGIYLGACIAHLSAISPIPEPATLALFGLGLAGLSFARRRKV
jgi:hypothetical protein